MRILQLSKIDNQVPTSFRKWIVITAILGYTALIFYLLYFVGLSTLLDELGKVNFVIYLLAISSAVVSITFHTMVWFNLLNYLGIKLSFRRTSVYYWLGIFIDNLIPGGWSGDIFKAYLLGKEPGIDGGKAVASVVAKNLYEAIFNFATMILGLILLLLNYTLEGAIFVGIGGILLLLMLPFVILMIISFRPVGTKRIIKLLIHSIKRLTRKRINLSKHQAGIDKVLDDYHQGMQIVLGQKKMFIKPMIMSFFALNFEIITLYLVFISLGTFISADKVIIVRSISGNIESQGYAFTGYAQIITTVLYTSLGVLPALAASVGILGGIVVFWIKTMISYVAFHCVIFAKCENYLCKVVRAAPVDECDEKPKPK